MLLLRLPVAREPCQLLDVDSPDEQKRQRRKHEPHRPGDIHEADELIFSVATNETKTSAQDGVPVGAKRPAPDFTPESIKLLMRRPLVDIETESAMPKTTRPHKLSEGWSVVLFLHLRAPESGETTRQTSDGGWRTVEDAPVIRLAGFSLHRVARKTGSGTHHGPGSELEFRVHLPTPLCTCGGCSGACRPGSRSC